ncbi:ACT domain-containing protein [Nymphaea thermarum]|nr:ACT domain-containing protein [Nymphaea thermarum]
MMPGKRRSQLGLAWKWNTELCVVGTTEATKVDSVNKHGILLEVVQVLTDLDLSISKAYISSDGGWFMDVFHVTDQQGNKVTDPKMIEQIEKALGANGSPKTRVQSVGGEYTAIELMGSDRPGLLSEISAVLADLNCNVVAAQAWSHNTRIACVFYVTDSASSQRLDDPARLADIQEHLRNVLRGGDGVAHTNVSTDLTRTDRRLHRMMSDDPDNELVVDGGYGEKAGPCCDFRPRITVEGCDEKGYSVVNVRCKDRPKLLFDTVCTLTDMKYVVFHASIVSDGPYALQEYYIRHMDGCTLNSEAEKNHVIRSLEAAILHVTRVLRENGLTVMRAEVSTVGAKAVNVFYVRDASGNPADMKTIESLRKEIGHTMLLNVKLPDLDKPSQSVGTTKFSFSFGRLFWKFLP